MMRFSNLTVRNLLIAAHDALATALAIFASFYLRFEGDAFFDRLPILLRILDRRSSEMQCARPAGARAEAA